MAILFDAAGEQILFGDDASWDAPTNLSCMFWAFKTGAPTNDTIFLGKGDLGFYVSSGSANNISFVQIALFAFLGPAGQFLDNTWTHIGMTFDASTTPKIHLKVLGVDQSNGGNENNPTDQGANELRMRWLANAMTIAHYKQWDATLTSEEYNNEIYEYLPQRTTNLSLWCPGDDETRTQDYSGTGQHGTLTGATQVAGPPQVAYPSDVMSKRYNYQRQERDRRNEFRRLGSLVPYFETGV